MILRQLTAVLAGFIIFVAILAAMSRLLTVKEMPAYIDYVSKAISNLYTGAFGQ